MKKPLITRKAAVCSILLCVSVLLPSLLGPSGVHLAHAATSLSTSSTATSPPGLLSIDPSNVTQKPVGTIFNVTVHVSNMANFTAWDVVVQTSNTSVITPVSITYDQNLFEVNTTSPSGYKPDQVANCINGLPLCYGYFNGYDGPGAAHSAATAPIGTHPVVPAPINGTLFWITYNVTNPGYSYLDIVWHSLSDTKGTPIPNVTHYGVYGAPKPDFRIAANPTRLNIVQGSNNFTEITLTSIGGFAGTLNLTASMGFNPVFGNSTLILTSRGTNTTQLTLAAPSSAGGGIYLLTVFASNATKSYSVKLSIDVITIPDFQLVISPAILKIHAGNSAQSTIQVFSLNGFSGIVNLTVTGPSITSDSLVSSQLIVPSGGSSQTNITISTPVTSLPYEYDYYVNGTSSNLQHSAELIVKPPKPSLLVNSLGPISVRQGGSISSTITVFSGDYFWGWVYASAIMNGGTARFDYSNIYMDLPNSEHASYTPSVNFTLSLGIGANTIPGNYIALVTIYSVADHGQAAITNQLPVAVSVQRYVPPTALILGLSPPIYFGILGALVVPFAFLIVQAIRKGRAEKNEESDWRT